MAKKSTTETPRADKTESTGKEIMTQAIAQVSSWSGSKKIIAALIAFMVICALNCFSQGSTIWENSKSAIHEIEALLYYVLAAINFCSAIILGAMFRKE